MSVAFDECRSEERLIALLAQQLSTTRHVAVGALSPIPAAAALFVQSQNPTVRVSLLGSREHAAFTDGGRELFDCAAQGRIDTFFLSGVQIDGDANINLVGTGQYPATKRRFAGSFGSAYLYHLIPNILLFCWNHNLKSLVKHVDFVSAAAPSSAGEYRPGGPRALLTDRCLFTYDAVARGFELASVHPGESEDSVRANTGFDFTVATTLNVTPDPDEQTLTLLRGDIAARMQTTYPQFVQRIWSS